MVRNIKGFTLMELMITVAIVGILASIAYPGYQSQIQKTRRADAKAGLMELQNYMERFFTENNCYLINSCNGPNGPALPTPRSGTSHYDYSFSAVDATSYVLQAVTKANSPQENDPCGTLTVSNTGVKTPSTSGCW